MESKKNNVGLEITAVNPIIVKLGEILANYQIFYTNIRGLHWNIQGDKFYELHALYEEYYNEFEEKIDEIAERIIMLGAMPVNNFSEYLKTAKIKEVSGISNWEKGVNHILDTLKMLLVELHDLQALALKANDSGTMHIASHAIKSFEKKIWMLSAYLKK